jgi:hypothetical protein
LEINQTNPELELVRRNGKNLLQICGEIDKPEVKKHILNLDHAWKKITALYAKGEENLFDTGMDQAMELHIEQQGNLLKFLEGGENNFDDNLDPLGKDAESTSDNTSDNTTETPNGPPTTENQPSLKQRRTMDELAEMIDDDEYVPPIFYFFLLVVDI